METHKALTWDKLFKMYEENHNQKPAETMDAVINWALKQNNIVCNKGTNILHLKDCRFKFSINDTVTVQLAQKKYQGKIISRLESHTGGIHYAVWANYEHGRCAEWVSEKDLTEYDTKEAGR